MIWYSCLRRTWTVAVLVFLTVGFATTAAAATQARVTVGSPTSPFPRNKQNEPAVAIDASRPSDPRRRFERRDR